MESSVTARFAAGLASLDVERFPDDVISKARDCLLDSLGCMLGGSRVAEARIATDFVLGWSGLSEAGVPGLSGRYAAPLAAYASAQFANTLDYDDEFLGFGHAAGPVIGTALALGQKRMASGDELLRAIVTGYEAAVRVGRATAATPERQKSVRGHLWVTWSAMATAASLLRMNETQLIYACGLTAQHSLVPFIARWYDRPSPSIKNNYGWSALGGILAAVIASRGGVSFRTVLDGPRGYWAMAGSDRWDPEALMSGFGTEFSIRHVSFKQYACVWYMHWALDALERILRSNPVDPAAVRSVVVRSAERMKETFSDYRPTSLLTAQTSLPHAIASIVLGKPLTTLNIDDPVVVKLADKVVFETDPSAEAHSVFSRMPATVELNLMDGRRFVERTETAPGEPENPLSREHLREKFMSLAAPVIGDGRAEELYYVVEEQPDFPSASQLASLFVLCAE